MQNYFPRSPQTAHKSLEIVLELVRVLELDCYGLALAHHSAFGLAPSAGLALFCAQISDHRTKPSRSAARNDHRFSTALGGSGAEPGVSNGNAVPLAVWKVNMAI